MWTVKWVVLALVLVFPTVAFAQATPNLLAQQTESLYELQSDRAILVAKVRNNAAEYPTQFCSQPLQEPARTTRTTYCQQKSKERNAVDADLRAQIQKLELAINQMAAKVAATQKALQPAAPRRP